MNRGLAYIEIRDGKPARIFRSRKSMAVFTVINPEAETTVMARVDAVAAIRRQLFERSGGFCPYCGKPITWETGHMHERKPRGKQGEISIDNSVFICASCHLEGEHGNRKLQW